MSVCADLSAVSSFRPLGVRYPLFRGDGGYGRLGLRNRNSVSVSRGYAVTTRIEVGYGAYSRVADMTHTRSRSKLPGGGSISPCKLCEFALQRTTGFWCTCNGPRKKLHARLRFDVAGALVFIPLPSALARFLYLFILSIN